MQHKCASDQKRGRTKRSLESDEPSSSLCFFIYCVTIILQNFYTNMLWVSKAALKVSSWAAVSFMWGSAEDVSTSHLTWLWAVFRSL